MNTVLRRSGYDERSCIRPYMLLRKVLVGLSDSSLKREVFRQCDAFSDVESLRAFCASFEAAERDATSVHGGKTAREYESAGTDAMPDDVSDDDVIPHQPTVAASRHNTSNTHKSCRNCGYKHAPDKASCPAQCATCGSCGKPGHFRRRCRGPRSVRLARP